MQIKHYIWDP